MHDPIPTLPPIERPTRPVHRPEPVFTVSDLSSVAGYGIWSWDTAVAAWSLVEDKSKSGHHPGDGPSDPGRFHGQTIRWASICLEESDEGE